MRTCACAVRVKKVGTGFHGTLAGNVYSSSKKVLDEIRAFKGMPPDDSDDDEVQDEMNPYEAATRQVKRGPRASTIAVVFSTRLACLCESMRNACD